MERLWQYAGRHRRRIYWGIAMLLFTNLCTQTMPLIMRAAIDGIELGETTDYLRLMRWLWYWCGQCVFER